MDSEIPSASVEQAESFIPWEERRQHEIDQAVAAMEAKLAKHQSLIQEMGKYLMALTLERNRLKIEVEKLTKELGAAEDTQLDA
jgi:regulator of replication initiation timing